MCHCKRLLIPAIAVVFLVLTLAPAIRVADAQASEDFTTLLQPGLNMVGWIHAETSVDALFADIPELEAVYAWDAKAQHFTVAYRDVGGSGNLTTLIPGVGLWLSVTGSEPVPWTREGSVDGLAGLAVLREGWNLVAWAGPDGAGVDAVLATVASSVTSAVTWDAATGGFAAYSRADETGAAAPQLDRGGALWIEMSALRVWQQPGSTIQLASPPAALGMDPFYKQYIDVGGVAVVSSAAVPDEALVSVAQMLAEMLTHNPELRYSIANFPSHVAVLGLDEEIADIPEFGRVIAEHPDWGVFDGRTVAELRAVGGTTFLPVTVAAEENALCYEEDTYLEDTSVHELAHTFLLVGLEGEAGPGEFRARLEQSLADALAAGAWTGSYAASNADEYWAEGVQAWFDVGWSLTGVDTRTELEAYDPTLAGMVREVFGDAELFSSCHLGAHPDTPIVDLNTTIEGTVLGPGGEPVAGLLVWTWSDAFGDWGRTGADGSFVVNASAGTYYLRVVLNPGAGDDLFGWYGPSGLTDDLAEAVPVVVEDQDVTGVVITLTSLPGDGN